MINKLSSLCSLLLQVPLASFLLGMGIFTSEVMPGLMPSAIAASPGRNNINISGKDTFPALRGKLPQQDGVYLYGRAPQPQQIGQEYMVFELHQGKVIGAFYLPYSEFSCFSGNISSGELALMVANAPSAGEDTEAQPQQIATAGDKPRIGEEFNAIAYPYAVALQEYYQLPEVSTGDLQILQTCQHQYSE
ncbi:hypothetical protein [Gloeocapsopsis sp. IPPAS B-1203]|uniref:hypothetical protein n=1 Tax=Gloeocapsopsis sp. IPPAS B-1203 TaxID=2049454 RepID=UPI000C19F3CD|nr:hypothetical protein [Gloeocapsopsis sp. IPPAS B-1203]PIG93296.1 hypothetical protein CSQ79_10100 [Gloeocapsopsis sp. IPPAS B-1203]